MPIAPRIETNLHTFVTNTGKCKLTAEDQMKPQVLTTCWLVCRVVHQTGTELKMSMGLKKNTKSCSPNC